MSTPTTHNTDYHPSWCDRDAGACGPKAFAEPCHEGYPERIDFAEHNTDGTEFAVEARRYLMESFDLQRWPHDYGFRLSFHGIEDTDPILNTDRMRNLANWLYGQADALDAWREEA